MRRIDREVTDFSQMVDIVERCHVCRLAMVDSNNQAYIVPLNFGYSVQESRLTLYMHCATSGKKLEILRDNPRVCFEMDCDHKLVKGDGACTYSFLYQSVIGWGEVEILEGFEEKRMGLTQVMNHQAGMGEWEFSQKDVDRVLVLKLEAESMAGKKHM